MVQLVVFLCPDFQCAVQSSSLIDNSAEKLIKMLFVVDPLMSYETAAWIEQLNVAVIVSGLRLKVGIRKTRCNHCHAESIKMPRPLLIFSQSDYLI